MEVSRSLPIIVNNGIDIDKSMTESPDKRQQGLEDSLPKDKKVKKEDLERKVDSFNQFLKASNTQLKFSFHEELNEYYVAIIDQQTNEIVKEIPPKKLLDMYAAMKETIGLFIDKRI
ncbi:flagellar protein FlaG [Alkalihalobacillus deserti]|uniref:flagellar protein FlaG n=1 Tax=Alkalihalobacillus deserti TaxID=2879466 RepID=UPI001D1532F2|nr:flagellar protein FlaG [Alkalihalobacillus deserti]